MSEPLFIPSTPTGGKMMCRVCKRTGYGPADPRSKRQASPWQRDCMDGHPFECLCGNRYASAMQIAGHLRKAMNGRHGRKKDA